jgi:hypothetical protein
MSDQHPSRTLRDRLEPLVGQVYFAPECHAAYAGLGFSPSPATISGVALPDGPAYFTSRGSLLGQVPGQVVAAAFAVFNPAFVVPAVTHGWSLTDADTIFAARHSGAVAQLQRVLGPEPEGVGEAAGILGQAADALAPAGKPLFAGLRAKPWPTDPLGSLFHAGDLLREYRGDAHTAAWTAAGLDAAEIGLLTELFWGLAPRTYVRTRAWGDADLDAAQAGLADRGWLSGDGLSPAGLEARRAIEEATDDQMAPAVRALGAGAEALFERLDPWGRAMVEAGGYPNGPRDLMGGGHAR